MEVRGDFSGGGEGNEGRSINVGIPCRIMGRCTRHVAEVPEFGMTSRGWDLWWENCLPGALASRCSVRVLQSGFGLSAQGIRVP